MRRLIVGLAVVIVASACALSRAEETPSDAPCEQEKDAVTATDAESAPERIVPQATIDAATARRYEEALPACREAIRRDPDNAERHEDLANKLALAGHTDEAIREYREAIRLDPKCAEFSCRLAVVLAGTGQMDEAFKELQHAIELDPDHVASHFELGKLCLACKRYADAAEQLTAVLQFEDTPEVRLLRCVALYRVGRYAEAIDDCNAMLSKDPGNYHAIAYRAYANLRRRELDAARRDAEQALTIRPERGALAHLVLGAGDFVQHDYDSAIEHLTRSIEIAPARPEAYIIRALARMVAGEIDGALADLDTAIGMADSPQELNFMLDGYGWQAYKFRGYVYLLFRENWDAAINDLTAAISLNNRDADCYAIRGIVLFMKGDWNRCVADLDRALTIAPENRLALLSLANVLTSCPDRYIRDGNRAVKLATKACDLTKWQRTDDIEMLAAAYSEIGDFANAVKWQSKVVEQARKPVPTDPREISRQPDPIAIALWWNLTVYHGNRVIQESETEARLELYREGMPYRMCIRQDIASETGDDEPSTR